MNRFFFVVALFVSCNTSRQETTAVVDSTARTRYEDFSEVTPFSIKEDIREKTISINGQEKKLKDYLTEFYAPDVFTTKTQDDSVDAPGYIVTEATVIEGNFFTDEGKCARRSLLLTGRGDFIDQEYYDLLFLEPDKNGNLLVVSKETFDGSQGQTSTIVTAEKEGLAKDRNCYVLKVNSSSEGGDVNLHKNEWVDYYIADEKGFHSVLKLQLEETDIQDYEVTQDENQNSSSEIRDITVLKSASHGPYDVSVHYVSKQNGYVTDLR